MKQTAPSARRFVTLRASGNNVMRKLEVHRLLVRRFPCAMRGDFFVKNKNMNDGSTVLLIV